MSYGIVHVQPRRTQKVYFNQFDDIKPIYELHFHWMAGFVKGCLFPRSEINFPPLPASLLTSEEICINRYAALNFLPHPPWFIPNRICADCLGPRPVVKYRRWSLERKKDSLGGRRKRRPPPPTEETPKRDEGPRVFYPSHKIYSPVLFTIYTMAAKAEDRGYLLGNMSGPPSPHNKSSYRGSC
jgi:hypothetical protein